MYAFRGFLTLLSRARSELPAGTRIEAALPRYERFEEPLNLFDNASMQRVAQRAGFGLGFRDDCDARQCDLRWGSHPTTCASPHGHFADVLAPSAAIASCGKGNTSCLGSFELAFDGLWTALQKRLVYARNHTRSAGLLRVALPLLHGTHSPLSHACVVYPKECRAVTEHLRLAKPLPERLDAYGRSRVKSSGWSHCRAADIAYTFVRKPLSAGLNGSLTYLPLDGSDWSGISTAKRSFVDMANNIVEAIATGPEEERPRCLHVNLLFDPKVDEPAEQLAAQVLSAFRTAAGSMQIRLSLPTGEPNANHLEMQLALSSALLLTEAGTHWSDLLIAWRGLAKLPSAVLWYDRGGLEVQRYGGPTRPPWINTFRSLCLSEPDNDCNLAHRDNMLKSMSTEAILCSEFSRPLCLMRPRSATGLDWG